MKRIGIDISVLNDQQKTGIGVYAYQLIDNLLKIDKTNQYILFGVATFNRYEYFQQLKWHNLPNVTFKIYKLPARAFKTVFLLWQYLQFPYIEDLIGDVNIFHSFNWFIPPQKKGVRMATIFDMTAILFPNWHHPSTVQMDRLRFANIKKNADVIITISKNSKKDIQQFGMSQPKEIIYPASDYIIQSSIGKAKQSETLKKYNIKEPFFLFVSTIEPRKNLENLINAFLKIESNQKLVIIGKLGWKCESVIDLISKNKDRIRYLGFVPDDDLQLFYKMAICLVYPSYYEGFGMPILEALTLGTPVICSNTSSMPEAAGKAAVYVDPTDQKMITDALNTILHQKGLRNRLIKLGINQSKKFAWKRSAGRLKEIYYKYASG